MELCPEWCSWWPIGRLQLLEPPGSLWTGAPGTLMEVFRQWSGFDTGLSVLPSTLVGGNAWQFSPYHAMEVRLEKQRAVFIQDQDQFRTRELGYVRPDQISIVGSISQCKTWWNFFRDFVGVVQQSDHFIQYSYELNTQKQIDPSVNMKNTADIINTSTVRNTSK